VTPKLWLVSDNFTRKLIAERLPRLCYFHGSQVPPCSRKRERRNRYMISLSTQSKSGIRVEYLLMTLSKSSWTPEMSCQQLWGYVCMAFPKFCWSFKLNVHYLVHDGSRNGRLAVHWYYRHVTGFPLPREAAYLISASWLLLFLGCHPKWRNEARSEVKNLITSHTLETISESNSPRDSKSTALSSIPLGAWESETPVLDLLIREALRIAQPHVATRRNVGPTMYIDGKVIPTGTLVVYPFSSVHLNPALYPDPWKFDPARSQPKADLTYLGWGGGASVFFSKAFSRPDGREPSPGEKKKLTESFVARVGRVTCLGARLARLTIKLVAALILVDFDFDTVDASGRIADPPPIPNWNDAFACRPAQGQFFLKYKRLDSSYWSSEIRPL
jgi:Cytochrome P450